MPSPAEVVRDALEARQLSTKGRNHDFMAQCPSHDDGRPSLHVTASREGAVLLRCFAGCEPKTIVEDLGLEWTDLFPDSENRRGERERWTPEAEWVYVDADGKKLFKVVKFPGKEFRQQRWSGAGWEWGLRDVKRQLYRLPDVLQAKREGKWVILCEGEKDADSVAAAGFCATANPGGAGKWEPQYTDTLRGAKVIVLADDDEPGRNHAQMVYRELYGQAARVEIRLPGEGHKDITDHLSAGLSLNGDLRKLAPATNGTAELGETSSKLAAISAKVFASRGGSDRALQVLGPLFQRGMRTVIGAQTGEGKTTLALQAVRAALDRTPFLDETWVAPTEGLRALVIDLEQGEETLKLRLQESGLHESDRCDVLWEPDGIALDSREEDRAMVYDVLREGQYDIVAFDPLYQMHLGSGNDEEVAAKVMRLVDHWAQEFKAAFIVPMHMRKPHADAGKNITKHDIAGVGTWLRNAEFILGLQVMFAGTSRIHFFKDRIGRGPDVPSFWWLDFDRAEGFRRNFKEDKDKRSREVRKLLKIDDGVDYQDLQRVCPDELELRRLLKGAHELNGRWRSKAWAKPVAAGQVSMLEGGSPDIPL